MMNIYTNDEGIYWFTKFHFGAKELEKELRKMDKNDERYKPLKERMLAYREQAAILLGEGS